MKSSTVIIGIGALGLGAWYILQKRAAAAAAAAGMPAASSAGASSAGGSSAEQFTMPGATLQQFSAPSLTAPTLPSFSLAPVSVNVSPLPFSSLNLFGPQSGPTPASFWAGLTPEPLFSSTPFASAVQFPSGAEIPLSQLTVRMDGAGNSYILQGGEVYQLTGPAGGYYSAALVSLS